MLPHQLNPDSQPRPEPFRWSRTDATRATHDFRNPDRPPTSQRQFARQTGTPRSTLQHWLRRGRRIDADLEPQLVAFLDSPAGYRFLRRLVAALHLVFHLAGDAGLRPLARFLQLTQLDRFVAASFGAQQALAVRLQETLIRYAAQQKERLASSMPPRQITACLDENFHGEQACLVAIEPRSNFLLLEAYQPQRDGPTWTAALQDALQGLPVEVIQVTSDQAKGLIACARDGLEAQHTPDLFHGQRDLSRATSLPLQRQLQAAQTEADRAGVHTREQRQRQHDYEQGPRPPGRSPDFAVAIGLAEQVERQATTALQQCQDRQEQARQAVRGVADDYHPFDARSGRPLRAAAVEKRLGQRLDALDEVVRAARLGQGSRDALAKARRWLVPLVASLSWFWEMVDELVSGLGLTAAARRAFVEQLLAGLYWQREQSRGRDAEQRQQRRALAERLLSAAWSASGALAQLAEAQRAEVARVAAAAVAWFVRSSSCVEGRNGRLSLYHHGQGPLSEGRLRALSAVHNFVVQRADGTTAAERFFGAKPQPVFEWLLERLPELPRPAQSRSSASEKATAPA
jgi:transcriptional regulator with XRE-family HTH domain